ncbi:hypothetical protein Cantr_02952 [Candida viswanathii]|uniref:DUF1746 domain-containing protein n=1 Tax=Candida viswanathii TaxID=5486 RepID=A0A367YM62_9ASCO|nr:hypothetical protein Cantr_02952 [Candida viswanathii]
MTSRTNSIPIELIDFQTSKLPTPQQTTENNHAILAKRKRFFLTDLKESIQFLEIFLIVLLYLRDRSFTKLLIRSTIHLSIININPHIIARMSGGLAANGGGGGADVPEEYRKSLTKVALRGVIIGNLFCLFLHLVFGVGTEGYDEDGYVYGGITIQFIGDRVAAWGRLEVVLLDCLVFLTQLVFHSLFGVINEDEVIELKQRGVEEEEEQEEGESVRICDEGDGYNGNVQLLTIDILEDIKKVLSYKINLQPMNMNNEASQMPGAFPSARMFVLRE